MHFIGNGLRSGLSVAVMVAIAASAVAGPALAQDDESLEGSLRVSTSANSGRPGLEAVAPLFSEATGVEVQTEFGELGSEIYTSQLLTQLQNGAAPDVFSAFPGTGTSSPNMGALADAGSLMDLSDTEWGQNVPDAVKSAVSAAGKVYAAIYGIQYGAIIYNTELFDEYGLTPPTTFDELLDLVAQIREVAPDKTPISLGSGNAAVSMIVGSMLAMNEPDFDPADLDFTNSAAWKAGLEQFVELQEAGAFAPSVATDDTNSVVAQMTGGDAFMNIDVTSRFSAIKRADPEAPMAMVPYPARDPEAQHMLIWPGTTQVVNADSQNPDAAVAWIEYVTQPEIMQTWTEAAGGAEFPPTQISDLDAWPEHFEGLKPAADLGLMIPAVSWPSNLVGNALGNGIPAILLGAKTVDDVLAEMAAAATE